MDHGIISGTKFHHIAVKTTDFDKSLAFYCEGLGMKILHRWGEGETRAAMVSMGDQGIIELFAGGVAQEPSKEEMAGQWLHLAIQVDCCDQAFDAALKAGATVKSEPNSVDIQSDPVYKVRIAFVYGPDGEIIEFFEER